MAVKHKNSKSTVSTNELNVGKLSDGEIVVVFDAQFNYLFANETACEALRLKAENLIGKNILILFPYVVGTKNHQNLLRAARGETVNDVIEGLNGVEFTCTYRPISDKDLTSYIVVKSKKVVV